ncbi:hypothetical protein BU24DRAFT_278435 [Aaosphaeria arxii CBS 175.79]|uniref:methylated diphthine methylhydrolase n=1 Tax=Aaosphaeria arxii CBS 175.79 TaxID=1450172 RepID=A0A6A5XE46_9PLEO|nr:uncharacterized protein BU24DRAFT_278435 [Aaosphaeria arxii CBS 175.79]KAF2011312.1 hypothetical protein BU24DRAFT_278435 [Aaosphaeria arxii CBS 175.79]
MTTVTSLKSLILDLPPSCVEFWPLDPQYAVVGTYNLDRSDEDQVETNKDAQEESDEREAGEKRVQKRDGSIILIRVKGDDVEIIQTLPTPSAILDIHFAPGNFPPSSFGVATSTGSFDLYYLGNEAGEKLTGAPEPPKLPILSHWRTFQFFPSDVLVTAFSWSQDGTTVAMTLTTGEVCLRKPVVDVEDVKDIHSVDAGSHDLEAWTVTFLPKGNAFFSGGDDSALIYWERPTNGTDGTEPGLDGEDAATQVWTNRKIHGAGVTAILPLIIAEGEMKVLTGSYDDHIRLLDVPVVGRKTVLAELNLGGGVWRLKKLDSDPDCTEVLLLASCMHAGARILRLRRTENHDWDFEVLAQFEEHKSMNYGSDSQPGVDENGRRTFVTTSFYDRLLCLWRY